VLWTKHPLVEISVKAASFSFIGTLLVVLLEVFEHRRTTRPSAFVSLYLLCSAAADAILLRTLLLRHYVAAIAGLTVASFASKLILLSVESWPKLSYLIPRKEKYGPEEVSGILNRSLFWWLNSLLLRGNKRLLSLSDLFPLDRKLHSHRLQARVQYSWDKCKPPSLLHIDLTLNQ
jgi:ATP-binding cassette subfamily C (CFTR/MRP) protein 1